MKRPPGEEQEDLTGDLRTHYARVLEELTANADRLRDLGVAAVFSDDPAAAVAALTN